MTISIRKTLAALPSGGYGTPLDLDELGRYIATHCNTEADKTREAAHKLRDDLYRDGGIDYMKTVIDDVYIDEVTKEQRKKWIKHSRHNNVIKRIVNETQTTYTDPAKRTVKGDANNEKYQSLLKMAQFDTAMLEAARMFGLHRVVLIGPRVRELPDGSRDVVTEIVTPKSFRVLLHPNDSTLVVGYVIRTKYRSLRTSSGVRPVEWTLWTDHEKIELDKEFTPVSAGTVHKIGACPWVVIKRMANLANFWPGEEGEDLVAGHTTIWMNNILQNKETKSATKQTMMSGDLSGAEMQQTADSEVPLILPEGVAASTVDMSMDISMFRDNSAFVSDSMANNHGMSSAYMKHQGVQSAQAREAMRLPLKELRKEFQPMFHLAESKFVRVLALVVSVDMKPAAFSSEGWRCNFSDPGAPLTPSESLANYEARRSAGLDNPIDYVMSQDPDLSEEDAVEFVLRNIEKVTWYWEVSRSLTDMGVSSAGNKPQNMHEQNPNLGAQAE